MDDLIRRIDAKHALCHAVHKGEDIPCRNQTASCLWTKTRVCDFAREIDDVPAILGDEDLIELEHRFGAWCRFVVEDMISGKGKRWEAEVMRYNCDTCKFFLDRRQGIEPCSSCITAPGGGGTNYEPAHTMEEFMYGQEGNEEDGSL